MCTWMWFNTSLFIILFFVINKCCQVSFIIKQIQPHTLPVSCLVYSILTLSMSHGNNRKTKKACSIPLTPSRTWFESRKELSLLLLWVKCPSLGLKEQRTSGTQRQEGRNNKREKRVGVVQMMMMKQKEDEETQLSPREDDNDRNRQDNAR